MASTNSAFKDVADVGHVQKNGFPRLTQEQSTKINATRSNSDKTEILQDHLLQSLAFPQMTDRENEVIKAAADTYSWLLRDESAFTSWLTDRQEEIYWINGKPGCGKSTLVRYVSEHSITEQKLKMWSGGKPFVRASYYFWTSGTKDQRSQAGLLRSLLYQLLDVHKELIPQAMPDVWLAVWDMSTLERVRNPIVWELKGLLTALRMVLGYILEKRNVAFFVDGLDEFDGDHDEIISVFNGFVKDGNKSIKLCLSSRSWPVFEVAYRGRPQFKLQDFTLQDITLYITRNLKTEASLDRLSAELSEWYTKLVEILVQKAEGVFLWANLAVRYICKASALSQDRKSQQREGLIGSAEELKSNSEIIQAIAESLPGELDDLFQLLVFEQPRADPSKIGLSAILLRARGTITDFTGDQTTANISAWNMTIGSVSSSQDAESNQIIDRNIFDIDDTEPTVKQVESSEWESGLEKWKNSLENASPGLLVHHTSEGKSKVTYTHRTVKDWLDRPEIQQRLAHAVFKASQPRHSIDKQRDWLPHMINLGICQTSRRHPIFPIRKGRNINELWPFVILSMTHARYAEFELETLRNNPSVVHHYTDFHNRYIKRVSGLNSALDAYWRVLPKSFSSPFDTSKSGSDQDIPEDTWTRNSFGTYESRAKTIFNNPWLSICTRFGLHLYVLHTLQTSPVPWKPRGEVPLLAHAVEFLIHRKNTVYPLSDPAFVRALLSHGFRHDEMYVDMKRTLTPWTYLLENLQQAERRGWMVGAITANGSSEDQVRWVAVVNTFLEYGAGLDVRTVGWAKDPSVGARELLLGLKEKYGLEGLAVQA